MRPIPRQRSVLGGLALAALTSVGCGMGSDPQASASSLVESNLPRCDGSLLHPRLSIGAAAMHPGKQIIYVDGVMACMDDIARVDQLVNQIEGPARAEPRPALPQPGPVEERLSPRR
jgi:hypothetical protein